MKRKITVLIFISCCSLFVASGQDSAPNRTKHSLGFSTGFSRNIIRDDVTSPLLYRGGSPSVLLEYVYSGKKSRHNFTLNISKSNLHSSYISNLKSKPNFEDNLSGLLSYSYIRDANVFQHSKVNVNWGFTFLSVVNYRNFQFNNSNSFPFFEQINSIGVNFLIEKNVGSKKNDFVSFKINIPFVAYVIFNERYNSVVGKSSDNIDTNKGIIKQIIKNGEFYSFNKLFDFQTNFSYTRYITKHIDLKLEHQVHFYSISHYRNLLYTRYLNNQSLIGLVIKL
jgi:hypothetical protein